MGKIKKDFMFKELQRQALCAAGLVVCLLVLLRYYARLAPYQLLLLLGVIAVVGLGALRSVVLARAATSDLTDLDTYTLEKEYTAAHPVYKVWQGEIHLMKSFLVCRNRGRLLFIPLHSVERVERRFDRIGMRRLPFAKFIMDSGRSVSVGFSPSHAKDSEAVFTWLAERLGKEKVTPCG